MTKCPHCGRVFKGNSINSRHKRVCEGWETPPPPPPCLCGHEATSLTQMKRHRKTCDVWKNRDVEAVKRSRLKDTSLERYGVEDASQAPEVRVRRAATNKARYGAENPFSREASTFDKVQAALEGKRPVMAGEDSPFAKPEVQAKIRATMAERYGAENPQQVAEIRAKTRATNIERYGGELLGSPVLAEKARATNIERYGVEFAGGTPEVQAKVIETNLERYGVPHTCMDPDVRRRQLETMEENYGFHFFASEEGKAAVRAALMERYGVEFPGAIDGHWEKAVATFRERYGVDHPLQLPEFLDKQRATNTRRYGWDYYINSTNFVRACLIGAGVPLPEVLPYHPMKNREYARKHLERMGAATPGPNGLERKVAALAPLDSLMFTGDRQWWRWLPRLKHHKNPDFILPGPDPKKPFKEVTKVVEAFGDFWHSRMLTGKAPFDHEQELIEAFAEIGIECLVVWESEVKADEEAVRGKLAAFLS